MTQDNAHRPELPGAKHFRIHHSPPLACSAEWPSRACGTVVINGNSSSALHL